MENVAPIGEFMFEFCDLAVPVEVERITEILALAQRESLEVMPSEARAMLAVAEAMLRADPDLSSETSRAICSAVDAACCVGNRPLAGASANVAERACGCIDDAVTGERSSCRSFGIPMSDVP